MKHGFIGLGDQGAPIARRMIDAGLSTVLWARRPESLESFKNTQAGIATSISCLARHVDYVGICVVDDAGVQQVCDQIIPHMRPGGLIVVHSTVNPELCRTFAAKAAEKSLTLIDAPVSGGGAGAEAGTLTVMVGGDISAFNAALPVFKTFGKLIVHLGDVGAGQHAKLINNSMLAANIAIAHYGNEAANLFGLNRDAFIQLIKASSGHSFGFDVSARMSSPAAFSHGASLLKKDVRLLCDALGNVPSVNVIRETAASFLKLTTVNT
ncbi:MAG: NAD(P)-dependent oxidoreductase [Spongiibacteraceae bacterium]